MPLERHAAFDPSGQPRDPIGLLEEQARGRVPELVPVRYGRMLVSPFTFFRGAAAVMAFDLAPTPRTGFRVQLCGDAHVANFGGFASPERTLVFDINDFDETLPGPWEWDVKRLLASLAVAGRNNGYTAGQRQRILTGAAGRYRAAMRTFAKARALDVWYSRLDLEATIGQVMAHLDPREVKRLRNDVAKARTRDNLEAFRRLTVTTPEGPRIVGNPPLIVPIEDLLPDDVQRDQVITALRELLRRYRRTLQTDRRELIDQFRLVHVARKVVGVGSVGAQDWIGLFLGRDERDPLLLQIKEANASVLEQFVSRSGFENHGQRVVAGQRLMQAASDIFLGWERVAPAPDAGHRDFYVRQLRDWKFSIDVEALLPKGMAVLARACAWTLARAHARSGDRIAIARYLGSSDAFDRAAAEFAEAYADQNERDHQALVDAVEGGRVQARTGV